MIKYIFYSFNGPTMMLAGQIPQADNIEIKQAVSQYINSRQNFLESIREHNDRLVVSLNHDKQPDEGLDRSFVTEVFRRQINVIVDVDGLVVSLDDDKQPEEKLHRSYVIEIFKRQMSFFVDKELQNFLNNIDEWNRALDACNTSEEVALLLATELLETKEWREMKLRSVQLVLVTQGHSKKDYEFLLQDPLLDTSAEDKVRQIVLLCRNNLELMTDIYARAHAIVKKIPPTTIYPLEKYASRGFYFLAFLGACFTTLPLIAPAMFSGFFYALGGTVIYAVCGYTGYALNDIPERNHANLVYNLFEKKEDLKKRLDDNFPKPSAAVAKRSSTSVVMPTLLAGLPHSDDCSDSQAINVKNLVDDQPSSSVNDGVCGEHKSADRSDSKVMNVEDLLDNQLSLEKEVVVSPSSKRSMLR